MRRIRFLPACRAGLFLATRCPSAYTLPIRADAKVQQTPFSELMNDNVNAGSARPRSWWVWVGFWAVLFVIMHVPPTELARRLGGADRVAHFAAYFTLASLGAYHVRRSHGGSIVAVLMGWAVVYFAWAALDEWLQRFVSRTPSFSDWLADVAGVLVATGIAMVWGRRSRKGCRNQPDGQPKDNVTRS